MVDVLLNPYLAFPSTTRQAMEFYKSVFGGTLTMQTFGEAPMDMPEGKDDLILHAMLESDSLTLMASDGQKDADIVSGTNISLSLSGTDEAKLTQYFEKLSEGGTVGEPLVKAPWGDMFGMLTDKYGIHWMINISPQ